MIDHIDLPSNLRHLPFAIFRRHLVASQCCQQYNGVFIHSCLAQFSNGIRCLFCCLNRTSRTHLLLILRSLPPIMTDWAKLKVVDLKEECKNRGIALSGLKLKQQYIDKLEEYEAQEAAEPDSPTTGAEAVDSEQPDEALDDESAQANAEVKGATEDASVIVTEEDKVEENEPQEQPPEPVQEEGDAEGTTRRADEKAEDSEKSRQDALPVSAATETDEKVDGVTKAPKPAQDEQTATATDNIVGGVDAAIPDQNAGSQSPVMQPNQLPAAELQVDEGSSTPQLPPTDLAEDQSRRRKRSATPVPSSKEMARKKARLSNDKDGLPTEETLASKDQSPGIETTQEMGEGESIGAPEEALVDELDDQITTVTEQPPKAEEPVPVETTATTTKPPTSPKRSRSLSEERITPPALHPATTSLYIRNFKRPLHIPSLRSHIVSLAKSPSTTDSTDPMTLFYLDSIRTHAFVSFTSIAAASRVRSALHGTRFPDETLREPLFVDYVPDGKVQSWIEQETGEGFGRGGGARRFEVVYKEGENGIEVVFQEFDPSRSRPQLEPGRGSRMSIDQPRPESVPTGVHADRAALIPRDSRRNDDGDRTRAPPTSPKGPDTRGRGFKALDELFDSTTTKPKLYYKPVPDSIAAERLDMLHGLRIGYAGRGRSGDEGMKRYSFDRYRGKEEWVDKGPEFGFGKRGQDRLVGVRGRGGFRGRGRDSWRSGSGR